MIADVPLAFVYGLGVAVGMFIGWMVHEAQDALAQQKRRS